MGKIDKLKHLLDDLKGAGVPNYKRYELIFLSVFEEVFGKESEFYEKATHIKSGWALKSSVGKLYGQVSDAVFEKEKYDAYIANLEEAIEYLEKYDTEIKEEKIMDKTKVFIVHGHNETLKYEVSNWLHEIDIEPIILHLQANVGISSIIDKIYRYSNVGCALVLFTADDIGKVKEADTYKDRARQNVVFEAGYFCGKLGKDKVIMLYESGVELPGDLSGCVYIEADQYGGWKEQVRKEFTAMGIEYSH